MAPRRNRNEKKISEPSKPKKGISLITETVDIAEEFNKYKSENNNNAPIVVISPGKSLNPHVVSTYEEKIIKLGGAVIFFEECPLIQHNSTNKLKCNRDISNGFHKFLKSKNVPLKVDHYDKLIFYGQRNLSGLGSEMTLSEFANNVNAFAVLVHPDQMMPLGGNFRYWTVSRHQKNGFATEYKIDATREQLELSPEKMLLFQAICSKVSSRSRSTGLVKYIKSLPNELGFEAMEQIADKANISFGELTLILKYFKVPLSYSLFEEDEEVLGNCHQLSFNILKGFPIPLIADHINRETFNYEEILLPIVRKQAGILLKNRNCNNVNNNISEPTSQMFPIITFNNTPNKLQLKSVIASYPKYIEVPPLNHLFLRKDYPELDPIRWELAAWCISNHLKVEQLRIQKFVIPYLCIWYLVENNIIGKFEGDSLYLAIMALQSKKGRRFKKWNKSYISGRAVQISLLFVNLCNEIKKLFCSIGLNDVANVSPIGGVVFLNIYQEMKEKSYKERRDFYKIFNFNPTCFDFSKAETKEKGKNLKHSKPAKIPKPVTVPKFKPKCLNLHDQVSVPLLNDVILKKPAKYTKKERKFKVKSLPWTQIYESEYKVHDPLCDEIW